MSVAIRSERLVAAGFSHAFSLRTGGVSTGPFASLNLARTVGDAPEAVEENLRRFLAAVPCEAVFEVTQVHGRVVRRVRPDDAIETVRLEEADALVATDAGVAVGVRVADCVPILLACPVTGAVAAVHAGWRGCVAQILPRAIDLLVAEGAARASLIAAVGPHIRVASFEIGEEVAAEIAPLAEGAVARGYAKPHGDLTRVVTAQLLRAGLDEGAIDVLPGCTFEDVTRFHSFRRDGAKSGRHLAVIVAR